MKKIIFTLIVCIFFANIFAQNKKKVALVSFYCDKKISGTGLGNIIEALISDTNFNLQPVVNKAYNQFANEYAKDFPFDLIENDKIIGNEKYKSHVSKFLRDTTLITHTSSVGQYVTANGLVFAFGDPIALALTPKDKRDPCVMPDYFPEADGLLFVSIDYSFESRLMGLGAGIIANINIFLYDKDCKKIFSVRESAKSKGKVAAVGGIPLMKPEKIQPLCEDVTEELFKDLKGRLGKIVRKSAKKF